jgi:hypothetical protein
MRSLKKINFLVLLAVLMCLSTIVRSQDKKVLFTVGAGTTYSTFISTIAGWQDAPEFGGNYEFKWSYYAEGLADIKLKNTLYLRTGLRYIGKGARPREFVSGTYRSQYEDESLFMLEVPINLMKSFKVGSRDFSVSFGYFAGYLVRGMDTYKSGNYDTPYDPNAPVYNVYNRMENGLNLKVEYELLRNINMGAGYEMGINNLIKPVGLGSRRTSTFTLGLGYKL